MDIENLEKVLEREPRFRLKQAREAVYKKFISNWNEATFLPLNLRERLNKECSLKINAEVLVSKNKDSVKAKIILKDRFEIETVLMRHKDPLCSEASGRNTVCVSSQVGCPMGCLFCATGKMGLRPRGSNQSHFSGANSSNFRGARSELMQPKRIVSDEQRRKLLEFDRPLGSQKIDDFCVAPPQRIGILDASSRRRALKSSNFLASKIDSGSEPRGPET